MDDSDALRNELNRQKRTAGVVTALWLALLGGMFVWQATQYHGFVELLAEWQYRVLDHYYPGITIALLSLFFSVPLLAMLFILWRRWRAKNEETGDPVGIMLSASRRLRRVCGFLALLSTAGALLVYVLSLWLPREGMPVHLVDIRNAQSPSVPEGSATVVGPVDMEALVRFDDRALLFHRRLYFAPVRYRLRGEALPARFFVQVEERADLPRHFLPVRSGVLARGALPGDVERLYRNIRYPRRGTTLSALPGRGHAALALSYAGRADGDRRGAAGAQRLARRAARQEDRAAHCRLERKRHLCVKIDG
jgi:hypothetical protein